MRKHLLLLASSLLIGGSVLIAQTPCDTFVPDTVVAPKLPSGITVAMGVDATVESWWSQIPATAVEHVTGWVCEDFDITKKPLPLVVNFKLAWDDDNLYVLTETNDQVIVPISEQWKWHREDKPEPNPNWANYWDSDNVEVFLNPMRDLDFARSSQVRGFIGENDSEWKNMFTGGGYADAYSKTPELVPTFEAVTILNTNGLSHKIKLPWEYVITVDDDDVFEIVPEVGTLFGFDYAYGDVILKGEGRNMIAVWASIWGQNFQSNKYFGLLKFGPELLVSTKNVSTSQLSVYPNPAKNVLQVKNLSGNGNISIYDVTGKEVMRRVITSNSPSVDIATLSRGVYMVKVTGSSNQSLVTKIVKAE